MTIRTRRTEIRIETHEVKVTRFSGEQFLVYCEECAAIVKALTTDQTAELLQLTAADVCRRVEENRFHFAGESRVCGRSIG